MFGRGTIEEWINFKCIIDLFTATLGMVISVEKSYFLTNNVSNVIIEQVKEIFPYKIEEIEKGFKYLVNRLKPIDYRVDDWCWLVNKFD